MDSVLILGAGLMQKPAILSAKELGFKAVVVDADENAVCVPLADTFSKIDLKAKEEILEYAKTLPDLKAVFTAGTDFSASVSFVAKSLGLPSHDLEAALNASNKIRMRGCFETAGVPSPKFTKVSGDMLNTSDKGNSWDALFCGLEELSYPLVIKPCDNMGGRGCRMVRAENEFKSAVEDAIKNSRSGAAIVEEYMEGPEFSIDALVYDGKFFVTGFAERHIKYPPYFIEVGHTMPAALPKKMHDELISVFALGAKSLGLTCGAAKADIKYTKNGAMIGEIAGRLSGGYMSGWTYPYASDLNLTKQAILIAAGAEPTELISRAVKVDFTPSEYSKTLCEKIGKEIAKPYELFEIPCNKTSAERAWISIPGVVKSVSSFEELKKDKNVIDVLPRATVKEGEKVSFPRNNVQKCGNVITKSASHDDAVKSAENAVSKMFVTLEANNAETDKFLEGVSDDDEKGFPPPAFEILENDILEIKAIEGVVLENEKFENYIPDVLKKDSYKNQIDWNYMTIFDAVKKADELRPAHKEIEISKFFWAIIRGGVQLGVYVCDNTINN